MKNVLQEIKELRYASITQIRVRYREVFQEEPRSHHREQLLRRLAWRLQSLAEGGLSERARHRAFEIANEGDLRVLAPRGVDLLDRSICRSDSRIPPPGSKLTREFRGTTVSVKVLPHGFECHGKPYQSLSAIASEVAGTRWNGLAFFGLTGKRATGKKGRHGNAKR